MDGKQFRLKRFLSRSDKLVIAAMDHGAFHGPIQGLENPAAALARGHAWGMQRGRGGQNPQT